MLLPLAILLIGLWQGQRGRDDWRAFAAERDRLGAVVADLEARSPRDGRPDFSLQFRHDGRLYGGPYAAVKAREIRDHAGTLAAVMDWRRRLPAVAVAGGGIAAALSVLVLLVGGLLGHLGRGSRDALVRGFSLRPYAGGNNSGRSGFGGGSQNDYLDGEALLVARDGAILGRHPQLTATPSSFGGAWYDPQSERRRVTAIADIYADWLVRNLPVD